MSIDTDEARKIVSNYPVGPRTKSLAMGARVSYEGFRAELEMIASEYGFEAYEDVRLLEEWAGSTTDPVWRDD